MKSATDAHVPDQDDLEEEVEAVLWLCQHLSLLRCD